MRLLLLGRDRLAWLGGIVDVGESVWFDHGFYLGVDFAGGGGLGLDDLAD